MMSAWHNNIPNALFKIYCCCITQFHKQNPFTKVMTKQNNYAYTYKDIRDVPRFSRVVVTQGLESRGSGVASKIKHCNSCRYVL